MIEPISSDYSHCLRTWLASGSGLAELYMQETEDLVPPSPSFPISPYPFMSYSTIQVPHQQPIMNYDTVSEASEGTTRTTTSGLSFQRRPILSPTPPSTRHRSPSPTRRILSQLKLATPSLRVCQPDARLQLPSSVTQLNSILIPKQSRQVIPRSLEVLSPPLNTSSID